MLRAATLLILVFFFSCSSDDDTSDPTPDDPKEVLVATLVPNFPANDGLYVADDGTVFASDFGVFGDTGQGSGTTIYQVSTAGDVTVKADNLVAPMQGVMDSDGNFYVTHENEGVAGEIVQIAPDGTVKLLGEIEGWPSGMTIDGEGNIYVANFIAATLHRVSPSGEISLFASDPRLAGCVGIDMDADGNVTAANYSNGEIVKVSAAGEVSLFTTIPDVVQGFGIGYMTIFEDDIYATGIGTNLIYRVDTSGNVEIFAGTGDNSSTDGALLSATFSAPNGIAADDERRILYISEFGQPRLRTIQF